MSSASGPPDPAGGDGNQKVEQKPLSEKAQVYRAYCMSAWQDFKDAKYDEANEMALWLLGQAVSADFLIARSQGRCRDCH